jgi:O-succinylhomoserine sulfhydrylase
MQKQTKSVRIQATQGLHREHSVPLYLTSSFTFEDSEMGRAMFADEIGGNIYSRYQNPNVDEFIEKLKMLEETEDAIAYATGMAAIFGSFGALLKAGDHVVASKALFGSALQILNNILPKWGINTTYVNGANISEWKAAITPETKLLFCESPSNPGLELIDLEALNAVKQNAILVVDNCFATPVVSVPARYGADLVLHSATKYFDGQGRVLGGVVCGRADLIAELRYFARHTGPSMAPFNAWIFSKSIETLELRMEKHCANALAFAKALEGHSALHAVKYPFLESHPQYELAKKQMSMGGAIVTLDIKGGFEKIVAVSKKLQLVSISSNLGDTRTIMTHPASTTHSKLSEADRAEVGITNGLVRVSIGLEHIDDLIADFKQALEA